MIYKKRKNLILMLLVETEAMALNFPSVYTTWLVYFASRMTSFFYCYCLIFLLSHVYQCDCGNHNSWSKSNKSVSLLDHFIRHWPWLFVSITCSKLFNYIRIFYIIEFFNDSLMSSCSQVVCFRNRNYSNLNKFYQNLTCPLSRCSIVSIDQCVILEKIS
jgi:hypothetical protein